MAYWIDEKNKTIPKGLEFRVDKDDETHYFLAVVEDNMTVTQFISKLRLFAQRMAVMNDFPLEAFKK